MYALAEFAGALYVATANIPPAIGGTGNGVEVWRSSTGDLGSWGQVNSDGFGAGPTWLDVTMDVYQGRLYLGLSRVTAINGTLAELWRTDNGTTWTPVFVDGLGDANNSHVCAMAEYQGELYISLRNAITGGQVWRSANGVNWTPVFVDGLGSPTNSRPYGLVAHAGRLMVVFSRFDGAQVWQTGDGASWQQVVSDGWGDGNNTFADYFDKADAVFGPALYIGTQNTVDGGEIWRTLNLVYLPIVLRGN